MPPPMMVPRHPPATIKCADRTGLCIGIFRRHHGWWRRSRAFKIGASPTSSSGFCRRNFPPRISTAPHLPPALVHWRKLQNMFGRLARAWQARTQSPVNGNMAQRFACRGSFAASARCQCNRERIAGLTHGFGEIVHMTMTHQVNAAAVLGSGQGHHDSDCTGFS